MTDPTGAAVYHVLFKVLSLLVDRTEDLVIQTQPSGDDMTFYVKVHPDDRQRLCGGRNEEAIHTILTGAGTKLGRSFRMVLADCCDDERSEKASA